MDKVSSKMDLDSPDIILSEVSDNSRPESDSNDFGNTENNSQVSDDHITKLQQQVIANFQKPNLPNVNVPERIIICLDMCCDDKTSLFRLGDGTTFTPFNMLRRILDFFLHSKNAINKRTEFALIVMRESEPLWAQNFTNNLKDIFNVIDCNLLKDSATDGCTSETFDFKNVFQLIKRKVSIPEYKQEECLLPPPYVVRMLVLYGRSDCLPLISQDDPYLIFLKKQMYFYIDILLAHEEECGEHKCAEIYDALQDLDNGYSYVYEVSRNATKIHDCIAKLLAHPLQRTQQRIANYVFGVRQ